MIFDLIPNKSSYLGILFIYFILFIDSQVSYTSALWST